MSLRNMEVQYIGDALYLPPLEREVSRIIVREYNLRDWEYFKPMWAGCDNCAALNRAAGLWAKADKRARELEQSIVRCRDCLHYNEGEVEYCEYWRYCNEWCGQVDPNGFCAWGERREDE